MALFLQLILVRVLVLRLTELNMFYSNTEYKLQELMDR